jgi:hypothetical protein
MDPLKPGTRARVTRQTINLYAQVRPWVYPKTFPPGLEFVVSEYVGPQEARSGVAFYWGSTEDDGRTSVTVQAADVEAVNSL